MTPPFQRLHPAARLAVLLCALVTLTAFNEPAFVAPLAAAVTLAAIFMGGAGRAVARALPLALAFLVLSVALWPPFIKTGIPLYGWSFYHATDAGVRYGLAVGMRVVGMLFAGMGFLRATSPEEFGEALRAFRLPPAAAVTFTLAFRLLPATFENGARALEAQRARGLDFGKNFFRQARHVAPLVVPVFLYSLRSVDQMATALELRGYRASRRPAAWPPYRVTPADWLIPLLFITATAAAVALRALGFGVALAGRL